jgi:hypothetical protein
MAKAFDSVGMIPLRRALERIKLPISATNFIINLFNKRKMRVITAYGLSDSFKAGDRINQGEVISPLIWRIFYDPLLTKIQNDTSLRYTMELKWPAPDPPNVTMLKLRITCTAFADDTAWISHNKQQIEKITEILLLFYLLNDIRINGGKSELIIINKKKQNVVALLEQQTPFIRLGNDSAIVTANPPNKAS